LGCAETSENVFEILRNIVKQDVSKTKKLGYYNAFVRLCYRYGNNFKVCFSKVEILCWLVPVRPFCLAHILSSLFKGFFCKNPSVVQNKHFKQTFCRKTKSVSEIYKVIAVANKPVGIEVIHYFFNESYAWWTWSIDLLQPATGTAPWGKRNASSVFEGSTLLLSRRRDNWGPSQTTHRLLYC